MLKEGTVNINQIGKVDHIDIIRDCLLSGLRVYVTIGSGIYINENGYGDAYFHVSDQKQHFFAYYQNSQNGNFGYASTSTCHNPNRQTGTGYQHFTEERYFDARQGKFIETPYTPAKIGAEHIIATLQQSKFNILSGKEVCVCINKGYAGGIFGVCDYIEVVL